MSAPVGNASATRYAVDHLARGWTPKAYKEREIPIPANLVRSLKAWKARADKTCSLVFPTSGCNVKMNFLDDLKACAERAKLDKDNFWLHKFRATFATRCLWAGIDLRTGHQWLGHSDMESTMRYFRQLFQRFRKPSMRVFLIVEEARLALSHIAVPFSSDMLPARGAIVF
jgi:integrase